MDRQQKRIAIFMPSLFGGGGQRSMVNLANGMAESGYAVDLVLAQVEGPFLEEVRSPVRIVDLKASRALTSLPALVRYLRNEQPDALLSVFGYVNIIASWAWKISGARTRLLLNEQNTVSSEAGNASTLRGRFIPFLMKRFYPWADAIVVVSHGVRDDMAQLIKIPRERITVIYNPSVVRAEVLKKAEAPLDHPWFRPGEPPVMIAVGRLQMQKDFPTLFEAFARVRKNRRVRLLILGEGRDREQLEEQISKLGIGEDVSLPGFVMNPYAYMARASLFVLSSRWEGLPTVLIEALCCGVPVVSTDCPSGPKEILRDGEFGRLVPVGDADALARAIEATLDGKASTPPPESWQPYDLDSVVNQYVNLLFAN